MSAYRLENGGYIDRSQQISFQFDGKKLSGFQGDTLASALLANHVDVIGRSFKYHRPRGILAAGLDEANAIMQIGSGAESSPNLKATQVELIEGLQARSVNAWPSLKFDLLAVNAVFKRFLPAGFYYKTFMWPDWHWFEPAIRNAAGLGKSPDQPDPDIYDKRSADCDILVIGGGICGLMAARLAAESGANVLLVEVDSAWGGSALCWPTLIDDSDAASWCASTVAELHQKPNVVVLNRTMAFGYYDHNLVGLVQRLVPAQSDGLTPRERMWKVRAKTVVLATGAFERPLVFPNNDRPGVMLASAGASYVSRFGVAVGRKVLIATNNDSAYESAFVLKEAGVDVVALVDARASAASEVTQRAQDMGLVIISNSTVTNVKGSSGLRSAEVCELNADNQPVAKSRRSIQCDSVLTSGGWSPAVHLFSQSGGKLKFDDETQAFVPKRSVQNEISIGAAAGIFELGASLAHAQDRIGTVLKSLNLSAKPTETSVSKHAGLGAIKSLWSVEGEMLDRPGAKAWVDFQNDVTSSDVKLALRENFRSVEHVKRYTTLGMASDQGKTSNVNGIGVMSVELRCDPGDVGTTKFRPPYNPLTIGAFAGRRVGENLNPLRPLPSAARQIELGAKLEDYGGWHRPAYYVERGQSEHECVSKEVLATRNSLGLFDASPLGKIEVFGPDAAEFLNRIYANNMKTLKVGRCRYGLMLNENGIIYDDGILARIAEDHYLVGTTSGHASAIADMLQEWLQCEWVHLDVATSNVTTNWAVMNVNGPKARALLEKFDSSFDFGAHAFPHMHFREGELEGVPCRIQRVSFSGELSYEVSVPWGYGASLFDNIMVLGEEFAIQPFGVESLMTMRIEKGFLHVGSDTDGMTVPQDVGFGRIVEKKTDDFVGRRSIMRPDALRSGRRQLVGLDVTDGGDALPIGGHVVDQGQSPPTASRGWVTSSVFSPTLSKPVALGLVEGGADRIGDEIEIWDLGTRRRARIVAPGAYDAKGERLHV
ncbi:MAG: sarcosine oxidase subunit alpha family protein [Henriciella sp.]|nr:sarcosine oxidase subunit alpha family protein [Henriciella sp.]